MVLPSRTAIAVEWALVILAYVFVAARIYVRLRLRRHALNVSDYWLLLGMAAAQAVVICETLIYTHHALGNLRDSATPVEKLRFASNFFFYLGLYFPKFSIINFYYNLVPPTESRMRATLYALTTFTALSTLVTLFTNIFWCGPNVAVNWSQDPDSCTTYRHGDLMRLNWALCFITEVLFFMFPFPLIKDVKLPSRKEKISVMLIFALGIITIAVSITRIAMTQYFKHDQLVDIWAMAQMCVSIIIVAMTALRPLLRKISNIFSQGNTGRDAESAFRVPSVDISARIGGIATVTSTGVYWQKRDGSHESHVSAASLEHHDQTGSQVELTRMMANKILKTEEITIKIERNPKFNGHSRGS
ncbi:hypothetical protein BGZ61DRAFT_456079 [Ilyonectria robusta]|uniref:uncharacterized protein n=1 Tax=Ilyonectria robusta TaxID=1079257 RepID=UPI001E8DF53B|nr:uncharacterized protein BGZ61DRAFT_456079 [Ilyonectria robusta]KAH8683567.1 hypothetical protein BGZ61DRAFT_456079 [Ilyonectria robusta]